MSSRPLIRPEAVLNADTGKSMAGNLTSKVTIANNLSHVSYGVSWSGSTPIGAISVQVSNDYSQNEDGSVKNAGTWNTLTFSVGGSPTTSIPVSGNTGNGMIDIVDTAVYALRLVYTATSGTGTLNAILCAKVA